MSVKPDDIPQEVWGDAVKAVYAGRGRISTKDGPTFERVARAIMAAEKRGEEREREACAVLADVYAEVNWQECSDNILLDPVLSNKGEKPLTKQDWDKSEDMSVNSTIHSSMYHAAQNIAAAIRKRQSELG